MDFDHDSCLQSKSTHKVLKSLQDYIKLKFDIIHSDVYGLLAIQLLGAKRYFVTFIDEFIHYTWIYCVQYNSDIKSIYQTFYNFVEKQFYTKIKILISDKGSEYVNKQISNFLKTEVIIHDLSL
jgi:hypothetical protein